MTEQELLKNKAVFLSIARQYIQREGLETLLQYLEQKTDFFTAPSSASFHLNEAGGLCRHSLNVFETAIGIYSTVIEPKITAGTAAFASPVSEESIAIACLFHDLCKTNFYREKDKWKKDENNQWISYKGYEIDDSFPFGHGEKSCIMINWFMKLHQDELLAIRWHMGMFEMTEAGTGSRFAYRAAMEKSPLVSLLQTADMLAANCLEKTTDH